MSRERPVYRDIVVLGEVPRRGNFIDHRPVESAITINAFSGPDLSDDLRRRVVAAMDHEARRRKPKL